MSATQVSKKEHFRYGQFYKDQQQEFSEQQVKYFDKNWSQKAQERAFKRYNQLLEKDGNVFNEIYDTFTRKIDENFGIAGKSATADMQRTSQALQKAQAHEEQQHTADVAVEERSQQGGSKRKDSKDLDYEQLLDYHHQKDFGDGEEQQQQRRAGTAQHFYKGGSARSKSPLQQKNRIITANLGAQHLNRSMDRDFFGQMDTFLEKTDKELMSHQRNLEEIVFKKKEIFDAGAVQTVQSTQALVSTGVPTPNISAKYHSPRQRGKRITNENELLIMKLTRALAETLEEGQQRNGQQVNVKLPFYCMKILNLLEREPTMFQDSIQYVAHTVEKYIFCLEEEMLAELAKKFQLANIKSKRYMYRELVDIAYKQIDIQSKNFERYKRDTEARLSEQKELLEQSERNVRQLEIDVEQADAKCQQSFERERKELLKKMTQLQKDNQTLQNEYRELKKQFITQQGTQKQMQEKFQKEKTKLEEMREQTRTDLIQKLDDEKNQSKQFKGTMTEIVEHYKTAICSLKVNKERIEELELKIQFLQQENQRLAVRAGANFHELTPRPELQGFYDLMMLKASDDAKKQKNKQQPTLKSKVVDFKTKSTKDSLEHICKQIAEYIENLRVEIEKKSQQPGLQSGMLLSLSNKYVRSKGVKKTTKKGGKKGQDDDAKSRISRGSRMNRQNSIHSEFDDLNDLTNIQDREQEQREFDEESEDGHIEEPYNPSGEEKFSSQIREESGSENENKESSTIQKAAPKIMVAPPGDTSLMMGSMNLSNGLGKGDEQGGFDATTPKGSKALQGKQKKKR